MFFQLFRSSESDRHNEHMDKVRFYHQSLQEQTAPHSMSSSGTGGDSNPSTSLMFSALRYHSSWSLTSLPCCHVFKAQALTTILCFYRKKLSELDNIQKYFSRKLSTPTFPSMSEQDSSTKHEEERDTDTCHLLLKSKQLVGEFNSIITGELLLLLRHPLTN